MSSQPDAASPRLDARDRARVVGLAVSLVIVVPTAAWLSGALAKWQGASWTPHLDL